MRKSFVKVLWATTAVGALVTGITIASAQGYGGDHGHGGDHGGGGPPAVGGGHVGGGHVGGGLGETQQQGRAFGEGRRTYGESRGLGERPGSRMGEFREHRGIGGPEGVVGRGRGKSRGSGKGMHSSPSDTAAV
jgi:hypothetical protein